MKSIVLDTVIVSIAYKSQRITPKGHREELQRVKDA